MESNWSINRLTPGRRTRKTLLGCALWCTGPAPAHGAQAPPTQAALRADTGSNLRARLVHGPRGKAPSGR
jgi:hypothetical protein